MDQDAWSVLQVIANHEKKVARHLTVRSLENYLPLYRERSRWTDRTVILERPLFLGYVFVRFSPQSRVSVLSVPGVIRLLGDSQSEIVTDEELERIREALAKGFFLRPHPNVAVGTSVRVKRGVFEGVDGIVTEFRHCCRVVIALSAVKQSFSLEVDRDDLEILGQSGYRQEQVAKGAVRLSQISKRPGRIESSSATR